MKPHLLGSGLLGRARHTRTRATELRSIIKGEGGKLNGFKSGASNQSLTKFSHQVFLSREADAATDYGPRFAQDFHGRQTKPLNRATTLTGQYLAFPLPKPLKPPYKAICFICWYLEKEKRRGRKKVKGKSSKWQAGSWCQKFPRKKPFFLIDRIRTCVSCGWWPYHLNCPTTLQKLYIGIASKWLRDDRRVRTSGVTTGNVFPLGTGTIWKHHPSSFRRWHQPKHTNDPKSENIIWLRFSLDGSQTCQQQYLHSHVPKVLISCSPKELNFSRSRAWRFRRSFHPRIVLETFHLRWFQGDSA